MIIVYLILWLEVRRPSFPSNVVEEIKPDCTSLQSLLIMIKSINYDKVFPVGMQ